MRLYILLLFFLPFVSVAQLANSYIKSDFVRSVELRTGENSSFPFIPLGQIETLELHFDVLGDEDYDLKYTLELRNADWSVNDFLNPQSYLDGYSRAYVNNYNYSFNTKVAYTHFYIRFPEQNYKPKLSGNYLIKVWNDDELLLQHPFVVYENLVPVGVEVVLSDDIKHRSTSHQINAVANLPSGISSGTANEFTLSAYQNFNPYTAKELLKNGMIENKQMWFGRFGELRFEAGNEFRNVSFRDLFRNSMRVYLIRRDLDTNAIVLYTDKKLKPRGYLAYQDGNGLFAPQNYNGSQPDLDSDYCNVRFTFESEFMAQRVLALSGKAFLYDQPRLQYLPEKKIYYADVLLKQGFYEYQYLTGNGEEWGIGNTEGNYMQTENSYQIILYRKAFGTQYDRVVGIISTNTANTF